MVYNISRVIFDGFQDIETVVKLRTLGENLKKTIDQASKEKIDFNLNTRQQAGLRSLEKRVKNQLSLSGRSTYRQRRNDYEKEMLRNRGRNECTFERMDANAERGRAPERS